MTANGFLEQKPAKATSLGIVLTLHVAVIGGVLMIKGQEWIRKASEPTNVFNVRPETPPPPDDVIPEPQQPDTQRQTRMDVPPQIIPTPVPTVPAQVNRDPPVDYTPSNTGTPTGTGTREVAEVRIPPVVERRPPVRVEAQFDRGAQLQPPYPVAEIRREREGVVRLRVTIGANGRVIAAAKLSATSEDFWQATQRQALSRWRFRPATLDGSPVESSKVLTVHFRLDDQ